MYRCEKGEEQYKMCKEANADYCSDCPHGVEESEADALFEEQKYKKIENKYNIDYIRIYRITNGDIIRETIRFCKLDKLIHIENYNFDEGNRFGKFLNIQELQAINKKVHATLRDLF